MKRKQKIWRILSFLIVITMIMNVMPYQRLETFAAEMPAQLDEQESEFTEILEEEDSSEEDSSEEDSNEEDSNEEPANEEPAELESEESPESDLIIEEEVSEESLEDVLVTEYMEEEVTQTETESTDTGIMTMSLDEGEPTIAERPEDYGLGGGKGTENDPYLINNYDQLLWFAKKVNSGTSYQGKFIKLTTDITINDTSDFDSWSAYYKPSTYYSVEQMPVINGFGGTFDGGNHKITGLLISKRDTSYLGLFGKTMPKVNVTIKNLQLDKAYVVSENNTGLAIGALVGEATTLTLSGCIVSGVVKGGVLSSVIGGLVGRVLDEGVGRNGQGGLVMKYCSNYATVKGGEYIAGMVGTIHIYGYDVSGRSVVIEDCKNYGKVTAGDDYGAGIASVINIGQYCENYSVTRLHNDGDIKVSGGVAGGVIGAFTSSKNKRTLSELSNSGNVSSSGTSGGVIGNVYANDASYFYPSIITVQDLYNTGKVHTSSSSGASGGVVGRAYKQYNDNRGITIKNSFNTGKVTGGTSSAVLGINAKTSNNNYYSAGVSNCYYLKDTASYGIYENAGTAKELELEEMVRESTFTEFDFANIWQMSSYYPVFTWQYASVPPEISNSEIIRLVAEYLSQDLYEQYEEIMNGDRYDSVEEKHKELQYLFRHHGITDVQEGIKYLSDTTGERRAYLGLMTDELYTATNYREWLTKKPRGIAFRALLFVDGLAFNNEINDWISFPTYVESEYPGVKKYKAMLYDFMDQAANEIEVQAYVKLLSDLSNKMGGQEKSEVEAFIEELNKATSIGEQRIIMNKSKLWDTVAQSTDATVLRGEAGYKFCFRFDENSGISKFCKKSGIVSAAVSLLDVSLTNFLEMQKLNARMEAYVQFQDFLETIKNDIATVPYELRWAAEQVMKEMEEGQGLAVRNFLVELVGASNLNDAIIDKIVAKYGAQSLSGYLLEISLVSFFMNAMVNLGETVQNVAFVEGYAAMAKTYKDKLKASELKFITTPSEVNAWDFIYNYQILYLLREKGEEYYIALGDTEGVAQKLTDHAFAVNREVAQTTLDLLRSDFKFDISGISDIPESVQYYEKMVVDCPVDIKIYDSQGNLLITLQDGVESDVTNAHGRFAVIHDLFTDEYIKVICLLNKANYKIEVIGVDKGLVDVSIALVEDTGVKEYQFANQKIEEGTVFTTTVEQIESEASYFIDADGDGQSESTGGFLEPSDTLIPVQQIKIIPEQSNVDVGTEQVLGVEILPANATNQNVTWFTSDESIATIKKGKLTALKEGTVTITAVSADQTNADITAECEFTIKKASPNELQIVGIPETITYGNQFTLSATGGNDASGVSWEIVSGTENAMIDQSTGVVTVTGVGDFEVKATSAANQIYNEISKTIMLTAQKKGITVIPTAGQSKVYGTDDPVFTYTIPVGQLLGNDVLAGALGRQSGNSVGEYEYTLGTLSNDYYTLTLDAANKFAITKATPDVSNVTASIEPNKTAIDQVTMSGASVAGSYTVNVPNVLVWDENTVEFTFVPDDNLNYNEVSGTAKVVVADTLVPSGTVTLEENSWNALLNTITFGRFFKETVEVKVTAEDTLSGVKSIEYIESDNALTLEDLKTAANWTVMGNNKVSITPENAKQFVYYIRITDKAENVTYLSTDGAAFDTQAPVISGITDGAVYYTTQKFTVSENNLEKVTVNDEAVTDDTLTGNTDAIYEVVAVDKAGNTTTVTVTMKTIASISESVEDVTIENYTIEDQTNIERAIEILAMITSENNENCTADEKLQAQTEKDRLNSILKEIMEILEAKTKIDAVEEAQQGIENENKLPDNKDAVLKAVEAKQFYHTLNERQKELLGNSADKMKALYNKATAFKVIKGNGSNWEKGSSDGLEFIVNGVFDLFEAVKVDGAEIAAENYTAKAGSTVITLNTDYLKTLFNGEHKFEVVYKVLGEEHSAECKFTVKEKDVNTSTTENTLKDDDSDVGSQAADEISTQSITPRTGDNANTLIWISMMLLSLTAMTGILKRKKNS